jgi:NADH dehydrogenase
MKGEQMYKLLCLGGGFAGLWAALAAAREADANRGEIGITLVSKDAYLTVRPRLYERDPETLRTPLLPVLEPAGVSFVEGTVSEIEPSDRRVTLATADGAEQTLAYDRLVLATGSQLAPVPVPGAPENAWNIDSYDAAVAFDRHLVRVMQSPEAPGHDTVVIVGAGFTGIELATEMRARLSAHGDAGAAARARVVLIEQAEVVGPDLGPSPRPMIEAALSEAAVELRLGSRVGRIESDAVTLDSGDRIETVTTVLTPGMRASPLAAQLAPPGDKLGRVVVDDYLRVTDAPGVFAAGDVAHAHVDDEHVALMSCQHAMPMGRYAGYNAARDLLGLDLEPYRQPRYVTCLDLGGAGAVFTRGWEREVELTGEEAKALKRAINTRRIYPPEGDRDEILAAAGLAGPAGRPPLGKGD